MTVSQAPPREVSIRYVKGVGPRRLDHLAQVGIKTTYDACYYVPRRYEDRTHLLAVRDVKPGELATVRGRVLAKSLRRARRGQPLMEIAVGDASGILQAVWFNQPYLSQELKVGDELILYGRVETGARPQLVHPELERVDSDETESVHMGRIVPIYPLASGMSQRWLRQVIATVLERYRDELVDPLPEPLVRSRGWPVLPEAIRELHFPSSWDTLARARERLAFEELFLLQVGLALRRARAVKQAKAHHYQLEGALTQQLRERLPFALTASQERVLAELLEDLRAPHPMHRLLQGDVGCGKTIVIVWLMAVAVQSGLQVALMAPTELLAEQHARVVRQLLEPLGVSVGLLSQGVPPSQRRRCAEGVAQGDIAVVIGTHALIQRGIAFQRLALAVIDEQHKFGVVQRAHLAKKGQVPDVLVVTATPIPRTLALTVYGDLDLSTITELPPGRAAVQTQWLQDAQRQELYELIREQVRQGRQGYVVYPLVKERATADLKAATQMAKHLQAEVFPEFRVGLLHGQMKPDQKDRVMQAFVRGELQVLVSTVIVEVGLDVPNATVMAVEHPERFGLAQLHQLRGRIGRSTHPATCVIVSGAVEEPVRHRLSAFVNTTNGFQLAEQDLEVRGPGALRGSRQHGWLPFRVANLVRDRALLEAARQDAEALVNRDPGLRDPALIPLRRRLAHLRLDPA